MNTYERIKEIAKKKKVSIYKIETDLGLSNGSIHKWAKHTPIADKINAVADYLGVSANYLMYGEEMEEDPKYYLNPETARIAQEIFENSEMRALFDAASDIAPENLQLVYQMVLALKKKENGEDL